MEPSSYELSLEIGQRIASATMPELKFTKDELRCLAMIYYDELPIREVASRLGVSESRVWKLKNRIFRKYRERKNGK